MYGPFPSRLAAERYCDAVLDLFKLRRCYEDLEPYPEHPGCVYGEMKKCIEPCKQACTPEQYAAEAAAVKRFFDTRGESMIVASSASSANEASAAMEFERAAALHAQWQKVKAAAALADWIVRPIPRLRAVDRPGSRTQEDEHPEEAALFLLEGGCLVGPERLSTLGVRAVREQTSVGSSLFAQPLMLQAVPLEGEPASAESLNSPEDRAAHALSCARRKSGEAKRSGAAERSSFAVSPLVLPSGEAARRRNLSGQRRRNLADPTHPAWRSAHGTRRAQSDGRDTQREAAKDAKTRILHEGRPDVERTVPIVTQGSFRKPHDEVLSSKGRDSDAKDPRSDSGRAWLQPRRKFAHIKTGCPMCFQHWISWVSPALLPIATNLPSSAPFFRPLRLSSR